MTTAYSIIFDSFMSKIKDWRLDALFVSSVANFEIYLTGFLKSAIILFDKYSDQDLSRNDTSRLFTETLTEKNIAMLAQLMVQFWLEKETQDVRQMSLKITDKDFKHYSEAMNLKEKSNRWSEIVERNNQALVDYNYETTDWDSWLDGTFYVSGG